MKRLQQILIGCCLVWSAVISATAAAEQGKKTLVKPHPNVLIIIADQWRAHAFGFAGDSNVKTPYLDRLAGCSSRFVNAVAGLPVCSPTRASVLTGLRPLSTGIFLNDVPLDPDAVSLGKVLRNSGYATGYIGKWHLNGDGRSNFISRERRQGFDYWKVLECTHDYNHSAYYGDGPEKLVWEGYDAISQTQDAIEFLKNRSPSGKPFFLMLAWGPPHDPYQTAPESFRKMYSPEKIILRGNVPAQMQQTARQRAAGYYAHCSALDDCFGKLWQALQSTGLEENTLLIFTADHGDLLGSHGAYNKQQPFDESIRVPFLVHWPAGLGTKSRQLDAPINSEDIMPTILGLCGAADSGARLRSSFLRDKKPKIRGTQTPQLASEAIEGIDYSHYLRGGKNPSDGATLISCVAPFGQWTRKMGGREYRGIRTVRYTYVRDLKGPWLLFDNKRDPLQIDNLVGRPDAARLQKSLDSILAKKLSDARDQFLPAEEYIRLWNYKVDANGTVPYDP